MISIGLSKPGNSWLSRSIDRETGGLGYCHAFIVFHDLGNLIFEAHADFGVRFRARDIGDGETLFGIDLTADQEKTILTHCALMAGDGYDFKGALHFEIGFIKQCDGEEFCSEAVVLAFQPAGVFGGVVPCDVAPNDLLALIQGLTGRQER